MKWTIGPAMLCIGLLSASSNAQTAYKCVVGGAVTFQQIPCEAPPPAVARPGAESSDALLLVGQWRSDRERTMTWLRLHSNLKDAQDSFLNQMTGYLTLTFTSNRVKSVMPDRGLQVAGKTIHFAGTSDDHFYLVAAASPSLVSISSVDSTTGSATVTDYHFEGHDTMWTRMDTHGRIALDPNARVYFRRIK